MNANRTLLAAMSWAALLLAVAADSRATPSPRPGAASWQRAVRNVDAELRTQWAAAGITPAAEATNAEFQRRVTLDIAGRIPTPGEVVAFASGSAPNKRELLVDRLLASPDYAEHWAGVYMDLLIGREIRLRPRITGATADYFVDSFADGKPMDVMTRELITATGELRENGAVSFLAGQRLRNGDLAGIIGATASVFLGVQLQCAQCHDHPYNKQLKKADFSAFGAYFAGTRLRPVNDALLGRSVFLEDRPAPRRIAPGAGKQAQQLRRYVGTPPRFLSRDVPARPGETRRQTLARAVLGSDLLAKVIVNRTWNQLLGNPIVRPWNDLGGENNPTHPALLNRLAADFRASGYDHRWLVKVITSGAGYGRTSRASASERATRTKRERLFALATVRPMTADQLFRSQLIATGIEAAADGRLGRARLTRRKRQALREYLFAFADDERGDHDVFTGNVPQALLVRNGALSNDGTRAGDKLVLGRILHASPDPVQRVQWLFITAYARQPTGSERDRLVGYLTAADNAASAYEDVFHALLTSTEFMTNH